jgi:hypothetical protein
MSTPVVGDIQVYLVAFEALLDPAPFKDVNTSIFWRSVERGPQVKELLDELIKPSNRPQTIFDRRTASSTITTSAPGQRSQFNQLPAGYFPHSI